MRPFGCPVTILNTIDHLGKFDGKADEGFFVGYSTNSKAFRVFNSRTRIVEENLHWLQEISLLVMQTQDLPFSSSSNDSPDAGFKPSGEEKKRDAEDPGNKDSEVPSIENQELIKKRIQMSTALTISKLNKKDERGIMIKNKARLVTQGYTQEEGINYDKVFAPIARIEAIRLFLAYASFKDFVVYQIDVKSAFLYGKIEEEVYVCQPPGFEDLDFLDRVYKVEKALYGLHQAPGACQDKYVNEILNKFSFSDVKTTKTPMETQKALLKDADGEDVDYVLVQDSKSILMFHLYDMKRIFRYLKGQPKLGLWYPKDSPFDLVAYTDSDYAGASLDRKSTTGGCQFLGCRLISWQCKKQTVVANSTTEVEYITKIHIDNESTICIVKNPVFHSKTKHIEIRHHFIRDSNEKKLIQMIKIHTDQNVTDLLTKAFDVSRFQYLIASIGMLNL
ncbi:putative reverse transcriptase, RNA-dependent DNA polymerase [Tanacetum coccineum]